MMRTVVAFALFAMFGAGVSFGFAAAATQQTSGQPNSKPSDYEKFYRETFRKDSIEKCIASAPKAAAAGFDVTPTCICASDAFLASKSLEELVKLKDEGLPAAELSAITAECLKKSPPIKR